MKKLLLAGLAATLAMALQTHAALFDVNYSDLLGNSLTGQLTATPLGGNQFLAISGSVTLASLSDSSLNGVYSLFANPAGTAADSISPSGQFSYNDVLYSPSSAIVDFGGILAQNTSGVELNLFLANGGDYALYAYNGTKINLFPGFGGFNNVSDPSNPSQPSNPSAIATAVPEVSTMVAGVLMLLPFGVSTLRIMRKNVMA